MIRFGGLKFGVEGMEERVAVRASAAVVFGLAKLGLVLAASTLRSHVSPRPLSLVKLRFLPLFLGAQKLRGGRKSAMLFWVVAFGRVLGA